MSTKKYIPLAQRKKIEIKIDQPVSPPTIQLEQNSVPEKITVPEIDYKKIELEMLERERPDILELLKKKYYAKEKKTETAEKKPEPAEDLEIIEVEETKKKVQKKELLKNRDIAVSNEVKPKIIEKPDVVEVKYVEDKEKILLNTLQSRAYPGEVKYKSTNLERWNKFKTTQYIEYKKQIEKDKQMTFPQFCKVAGKCWKLLTKEEQTRALEGRVDIDWKDFC